MADKTQLNAWVPVEAKKTFNILAAERGLTKGDLMTKLILAEARKKPNERPAN